jgi:hypothetical protein
MVWERYEDAGKAQIKTAKSRECKFLTYKSRGMAPSHTSTLSNVEGLRDQWNA